MEGKRIEIEGYEELAFVEQLVGATEARFWLFSKK